MTRCRAQLEKRLRTVREENRVLSRKVADKLLGIKKFAYLRPVPASSSKYVHGWKVVKTFSSRQEAYRHAVSQRVTYFLIEEVVE